MTPPLSAVRALPVAPRRAPAPDAISIRGVRLPLAELVDRRLFEPTHQARLRDRLHSAQPFPHLVLEGIFNPRLLELVGEEFDQHAPHDWIDVRSPYEATRRQPMGTRLGPASQLYFDIVNADWFMAWISAVTGIPYLLPDPKLFGGGLHESRPGATFAVHRDFQRHPHLGLKNEMVFITYLNKGWRSEWGGALELWDAPSHRCAATVLPEFGRSILMPHNTVSYHGHPSPMRSADDGRPRRSLAAYYYSSPRAGTASEEEVSSAFLERCALDGAKRWARMLTPPLLWSALRRLTRRRSLG